MRTPPPEVQQSYQRGGGYGHEEPTWMREEPGGETLSTSSVHETTPIRGTGSVASSAPSSVGRPSRGVGVTGGYAPYGGHRFVSPQDIRRGVCLNIFRAVNAITVISALSVAVAEILSIIYHDLTPQGIAIRVYGVLFAFAVIFTEFGWTQAIRDTLLLQSWVSRGVVYAFVGLLALEQEAEKTASVDIVNVYIKLAGWGLVALGILYFIMGTLCLKRIRDRQAAEYTILKSQAELEEALRRHTGGKASVEGVGLGPGGGPATTTNTTTGYSSVVI